MTELRRYSRRDIEKFLRAVDYQLARSFEMVIIGGAALALSYHGTEKTVDIDTANRLDEILEACKRASRETGLAMS